MTKSISHKKLSDAISLRKGKKDLEELIKKNSIEGECFSDRAQALFKHLLSHNGIEEKEIECPYGTENGDHVDCAKDFDQKARIHKVTKAFCVQCWEREQRKKVEHRAIGVQVMKAEIHCRQESINQTIKEQKEKILICPKTELVIPADQCQNCDLAQQKRCQTVMRESDYQRELAKIRTLVT